MIRDYSPWPRDPRAPARSVDDRLELVARVLVGFMLADRFAKEVEKLVAREDLQELEELADPEHTERRYWT